MGGELESCLRRSFNWPESSCSSPGCLLLPKTAASLVSCGFEYSGGKEDSNRWKVSIYFCKRFGGKRCRHLHTTYHVAASRSVHRAREDSGRRVGGEEEIALHLMCAESAQEHLSGDRNELQRARRGGDEVVQHAEWHVVSSEWCSTPRVARWMHAADWTLLADRWCRYTRTTWCSLLTNCIAV